MRGQKDPGKQGSPHPQILLEVAWCFLVGRRRVDRALNPAGVHGGFQRGGAAHACTVAFPS